MSDVSSKMSAKQCVCFSEEGSYLLDMYSFWMYFVFFFSLCVILFTKQGQHEKEKLVLKLLAKDKNYLSEERVKFLYVYVDVQRDLIAEFKDGKKDDKCADNSTASKVNALFILYF